MDIDTRKALEEAWGFMTPATRAETLARMRAFDVLRAEYADFLAAAFDCKADLMPDRRANYRMVHLKDAVKSLKDAIKRNGLCACDGDIGHTCWWCVKVGRAERALEEMIPNAEWNAAVDAAAACICRDGNPELALERIKKLRR